MRKWLYSIWMVLCLCVSTHITAQDKGLFEQHWFIQQGDTMPYRILLALHYDPNKQYPLVFFLHGRGESGSDNSKQLANGANLFLTDSVRERYPAIVVFPQCPANNYWSNVQMVTQGSKQAKRDFFFVADAPPSQPMQQLMQLVGNIMVRYPVKKDQVYVMGLSMGGMGTFELVKRMPRVFAAAVPICGGAHPATAKQLKGTSWWIFHGGKDDIVLPIFSEQMHAAMKKAGVPVKLTMFPNANHNSWDPAFAEPSLLPWLFAQRKISK